MVILNPMKTAISLPDDLFAAADRLARRFGLSRSQLYQKALADFLARHDDDDLTARLDAALENAGAVGVDPVLAAIQRAGLAQEDW
jgi:predicted transcriptional regulator